jgi:NADPH-dependent 2,4-dienoyl-CoA reductase/sulfur reductase-like enzyme
MTGIAKNLYIKTSPTFYKLSGFPQVPVDYEPGPYVEPAFLKFEKMAGDAPKYLETDIIIVGSGCGGGVCAKNLAEAGHKVTVVEKSYYFPPSSLPMTEKDASIHLFEQGGNIMSDDGSV